MSIYTMQAPGFADPERQRALRDDQQDASSNFMGGLESAIGNYYETQKQSRDLSGASDILSNLGKDYELEDILALGKQMNAHPNAIQAALHMGQSAQEMRLQKQRYAPQPKVTDQQKAAYKTFNDYMSIGNDMVMFKKDMEGLQGAMDAVGDKMGSWSAKAAETVPGGKFIEPAWAK